VVEAVLADSAELAERVRPWGANGREEGLGTDRREGPVEAGGELGVPVADEKPHPPAGLLKLKAKLRATWVTHGPFGFAVTPSRCTTRRSTSITNST
jgi:hypothetical protein